MVRYVGMVRCRNGAPYVGLVVRMFPRYVTSHADMSPVPGSEHCGHCGEPQGATCVSVTEESWQGKATHMEVYDLVNFKKANLRCCGSSGKLKDLCYKGAKLSFPN